MKALGAERWALEFQYDRYEMTKRQTSSTPAQRQAESKRSSLASFQRGFARQQCLLQVGRAPYSGDNAIGHSQGEVQGEPSQVDGLLEIYASSFCEIRRGWRVCEDCSYIYLPKGLDVIHDVASESHFEPARATKIHNKKTAPKAKGYHNLIPHSRREVLRAETWGESTVRPSQSCQPLESSVWLTPE